MKFKRRAATIRKVESEESKHRKLKKKKISFKLEVAITIVNKCLSKEKALLINKPIELESDYLVDSNSL